MNRPLEGKVALITGGGSGLGAAMARRFHQSGASIVVTGRRKEPIEEIAQEVGGLAIDGDVLDIDHLHQAVQSALKEYGGLDIAVANAGIIFKADATSIEHCDWQKMLDINLTGAMNTAKAAIPAMIERGGGSIINISSITGIMAANEAVAYCTTKSALIGLTRSLAIDYGPKGIRANVICPGWFRSEMSKISTANLSNQKNISVSDAEKLLTQNFPLKRMAEADEIAACAEFLASDNASFVTGTTLIADGGGSIVDIGTLGFR